MEEQDITYDDLLDALEHYTNTDREPGEYTAQEVADRIKKSEQSARDLLKKLIAKGKVSFRSGRIEGAKRDQTLFKWIG